MGFKPYTVDGGYVPPHEYMEVGADVPKVGMALKLNEGKLTKASGSDMPEYISMTEMETASEGAVIPVIRVSPNITFETSFSADGKSVKPGDKLTLSEDGLEVTATTGGCAEVVAKEGDAVGDRVFIRFATADAAE